MDAELVEYELRRASIPFDARCVDTRDGFVARARRLPARPDPLRLHPAAVRRHGGAVRWPASERPRRPFLIVTGSVNEETAVGCMKAGRHRLPAQEQPRPHRAGHRGGPGPGRVPGGEGARRGGAPPLRGQPAGDLQHQPPGLRPGGPRRHHPGAQPHRRGTGPRASSAARLSEGDRIHDFIPEAPRSFQAALGRRGPERRALPPRHRRRRALVRDHPRAGGGRARHRHRRVPQRPRRERAEAGRAGAARERGPLPRPVRQRQRPGLHHHARRHASST